MRNLRGEREGLPDVCLCPLFFAAACSFRPGGRAPSEGDPWYDVPSALTKHPPLARQEVFK